MNNRIDNMFEEMAEKQASRIDSAHRPHRINEVLEELFVQYEHRFPGVRIAVVETRASAV